MERGNPLPVRDATFSANRTTESLSFFFPKPATRFRLGTATSSDLDLFAKSLVTRFLPFSLFDFTGLLLVLREYYSGSHELLSSFLLPPPGTWLISLPLHLGGGCAKRIDQIVVRLLVFYWLLFFRTFCPFWRERKRIGRCVTVPWSPTSPPGHRLSYQDRSWWLKKTQTVHGGNVKPRHQRSSHGAYIAVYCRFLMARRPWDTFFFHVSKSEAQSQSRSTDLLRLVDGTTSIIGFFIGQNRASSSRSRPTGNCAGQ